MLQACERVTAYTAGMDQADFLSDRRTNDEPYRSYFRDRAFLRSVPVAFWRSLLGV